MSARTSSAKMSPAKVAPRSVDREAFLAVVEALTPLVVRRRDGTVSLPKTIPRSLVSSPQAVATVRASMEHLNKEIRAHRLKNSADLHVSVVERQAASGGRNGFKRHWWGWELYLDSYWSAKLTNAGWTAAGIAGVLSAAEAAGIITLPAALPTGVLAAAFALASGVLGLCTGNKGMVIRGIWPPVHSVWCWEQ